MVSGQPKAPGEAGSCGIAAGLGSCGGIGDDGFTVADDDVLAGERLELGDQIAGAAVFVDPGFVVSRPEITKCGHGVRKQVVDDGQHRVAGGDDGFLLATASGQAPVTGAQEGVGTRIGEGDAPEGACEPWVSPTAALAFGLTGRLVGLRAELGPRHQMRVRGESGHVDADLISAISSAAATASTPGISASRAAWPEKGPISFSMRASSAAIWALIRSVLSSIMRRIAAWWSVKNPRSASSSWAVFLRARPLASWASARGSRCPAIKASIIARAVTPCSSDSTDEILIWASSSSFSMRCCSRVRSCTRARR